MVLDEMAVSVGIPQSGYLVYVNTNDSGNIPHFHYVDLESNGKDFNVSIRIDVAQYFKHKRKMNNLSAEQKICLQEFLASSFAKKRFHGTNWDYIVMMWNMNNSGIVVDEDLAMPDYRNLK